MNQNTIETTPTWQALAAFATQVRDPIPDTPPTPPAECMSSLAAIAEWLNAFEREHAPEAARLITDCVNCGAHMEIPSEAVGWAIRERMNFVARWALAMGAEFFPHGSLAEAVLWLNGRPWESAGRFHLVDHLSEIWWGRVQGQRERKAGEQSLLDVLVMLPPQELAWACVDLDLRGAEAQDIPARLQAAVQAQDFFPELRGYKFSFGAVALERVSERQLELNFETIPVLEALRDIGHELAVQVIVTKTEAVFLDPSDEPAWPYWARYRFPSMGQTLCVPQPQLEQYLAASGIQFFPGESGAWYDEAEDCVLFFNTRSQHRLVEAIMEGLATPALPPEDLSTDDPLEGMS